jgi:hypothetical protein
MNRTRRYKLFYGVALLAFALAAGLIGVKAGGGGLLAVAIVCLLPGRIGGYYLKDLFRSRNLADQLRCNEAIDAGDTFLADLRRQPWRRRFIYCFFGFHSRNVGPWHATTSVRLACGLGISSRRRQICTMPWQMTPTSHCPTSTSPSLPMYKGA